MSVGYQKPTKQNRQRRRAPRPPIGPKRGGFVAHDRDTGAAVLFGLERYSMAQVGRVRLPLGVYVAPVSDEAKGVDQYVRDGNGRMWLGSPRDGFECVHPRVLRRLRKAAS